ncbi:MAG: RNA-binding S4 domain-containing protein [Mangrovibacterium sp.]
MSDQVRIDKWLWAVRIFKTRSIATDACKKGRVSIGDKSVKASRMISVGEVISVRKPPITYKFRVDGVIGKRVGAKLAPDYMSNITPASELELLEVQKHMGFMLREKGTGRPTKKERRDMDDFFGDDFFEEDWENDLG